MTYRLRTVNAKSSIFLGPRAVDDVCRESLDDTKMIQSYQEGSLEWVGSLVAGGDVVFPC